MLNELSSVRTNVSECECNIYLFCELLHSKYRQLDAELQIATSSLKSMEISENQVTKSWLPLSSSLEKVVHLELVF